MIFIITTEEDNSTNDVIDWIKYWGYDYIRINSEIPIRNLKILVDKKSQKIELDNYEIKKNDIIWYRKGIINLYSDIKEVEDVYRINRKIKIHLSKELSTTSNYIHRNLNGKMKLGNFNATITLNKLDVLSKARKAKLEIPPTLVTDNKDDLKSFFEQYEPLITKPIFEAPLFTIQKKNIFFYTSEIRDISNIPQKFFPSLFQEKIDKAFEIRVFFLKNNYYSMAIFSQNDLSTSVDFRNYNRKLPNRTVPFKIPREIKVKLQKLMRDLELDTGSIDLILDKKGTFFFLEVNPVGQYEMVSNACNYHLNKKIAEQLMKNNGKYKSIFK